MGNKPFQFKQFKIEQDRCAMKIGSDAVLLGALLNVDTKAKSALEIGSGTGVISLMLAQRYPKLSIKSLEIDEQAQCQCKENFEASPWSDRLESVHIDFLNFETDEKFDLVFSNPPYFSKSLLSESEQRNLARHIDQELFFLWIDKMCNLLKDGGVLAMIIPSENVQNITDRIEGRMILESNTMIRSFPETEVIRNIICYKKTTNLSTFNIKSLSIYSAKDEYSAEYEFSLKHFLTIF